MTPEIHVDNVDGACRLLAREFYDRARHAIGERGRFAVALPGGSVAVNAFPALAVLPLDWGKVHFFWVDERAVPPRDPGSNYGIARALWLDPARVSEESIHRMPVDRLDLEIAADAYAEDLVRVVSAPVRLDFVLLGVGADGHVASLFPGSATLAEEARTVAAVVDAPGPYPKRLTMTMPVLVAADRLVVAAFGESKSSVLRDALDTPSMSLPIGVALSRSSHPLVLADPAAAALSRAAHRSL